jgi:hypothetical protein
MKLAIAFAAGILIGASGGSWVKSADPILEGIPAQEQPLVTMVAVTSDDDYSFDSDGGDCNDFGYGDSPDYGKFHDA